MRADALTDTAFDALPLLAHGESKVVRDLGAGLVAIRFRPTVYSYTHHRAGEVPGTDGLRLRATRVLVGALRARGIAHAYLDVGERFVIARRVSPPPIEVIVKRRHVGTPRHRYRGMEHVPIRVGHPAAGGRIEVDAPYPTPWVRFDWRNPQRDPATGERLADEVLPEPLADCFIDVGAARATALAAFEVLSEFLDSRGIELVDLCLFLTEDGRTVFGELGPDCARLRSREGSLDKDVFRLGGSSERVLEKYEALCLAIE